MDRNLLFSHFQFHQTNFKITIRTLLDNSYPLTFIYNAIRQRLKFYTYSQLKINIITNKNKFFTIPFVKSIS